MTNKTIVNISKKNKIITKHGNEAVKFNPDEHFYYQPLNNIWGALLGSPLKSGKTEYYVPDDENTMMMIPADGSGVHKISVYRGDVHKACAKYMQDKGVMAVKNALGGLMYPTDVLAKFIKQYVKDIKTNIEEMKEQELIEDSGEKGEDNVEHSN